jgi:hypothetical protein
MEKIRGTLLSLWSRIRIAIRRKRMSDLRHGEMGTAEDFDDLVRPEDIAAARAVLDPANVPLDLRPLLPIARHWGIGCDAIRGVVVDSAGEAEKVAFAHAVNPHNARITAWLDSMTEGYPMSDEAAAFMYMQVALTDMGLYREEEPGY